MVGRTRVAVGPTGRENRRAEPPVRVVHLLHRLSVDGGVQVTVRRLAEGVDPGRVELHVVTARPALAADRLDELPAAVHALGAAGFTARRLDRLRVVLRAARTVRRLRPDVVQLHSGSSWMGLLTRLVVPRAAFVLEVHDAPGSGRHSSLTDRAEAWWLRVGGATALCHSSAVAADVRERWRPRPGQVRVVPLAVDVGRFAGRDPEGRGQWRGAHGIAADDVVLVVAGRLAPSKRVDRAIRALAQLRGDGSPAVLVVVGRGTEEAPLRRLAADVGVSDHVRFLGFVEDDDFAAVLDASDLMCLPSEYEGFGLTVVEGMAAGLPVVATAVGGVTDILVDGETGLLVPPDDEAAFVAALRRVVGDADLRRGLGERGRERARRAYDLPSMVEAVTDLYRQVGRPDARR